MKRATRQKPSNDGAVMLARSPRATQLAGHRLPALDGLRGIGIAAVVVYHLDPSWLPGGYLGVDIFFVVSGFLITWLLFELLGAGGPVGPALRQFWARRARRLLPALVTVILCVTLFASFFARDAIPLLRADIPAALGFVANWQLLFHHDSYFESMGRPPLLLHLWSLGVEEQFYLLWPFVVLAVLRLARRPERAMTLVAGTGAAFSAFLMAAFFVPGHDPSSVYYDTFTHSSGLMIGAALAGAVHNRFGLLGPTRPGLLGPTRPGLLGPTRPGLLGPTRPGEPPHRAPGAGPRAWTGALSLAGLATLLALMGANTNFAYRGGIFLASVLTGLALLISRQPGIVQKALGCRPLRYLGKRSYSLYLWHWPIICLTRPDVDVPISGWPLLVLRVALMGLAAEASYKLIEQPFRTGRAQTALRSLSGAGRTAAVSWIGLCGAYRRGAPRRGQPTPAPRCAPDRLDSRCPCHAPARGAGCQPGPGREVGGQPHSPPASTRRHASTRPPTTIAAVTTRPRASTRPSTTTAAARRSYHYDDLDLHDDLDLYDDLDHHDTPAHHGAQFDRATAHDLVRHPSDAPGGSATTTTTTSAPKTGRDEPGKVPPSHSPAKVHASRPKLGHKVLAIGDSVLVAASASLQQRLHGDITIDAVVGRQVWSGIARLAAYKAAGDLVGLKCHNHRPRYERPDEPARTSRKFRALSIGVPLLVFVNVRVPLPWQSETNSSLAAVAGQPGIAVVNWYSASAAPGVLWPDAVHPDPKGQDLYAKTGRGGARATGPPGNGSLSPRHLATEASAKRLASQSWQTSWQFLLSLTMLLSTGPSARRRASSSSV
jgi:peptidoglycan/LPS O-acetylase OafA/YrhL